MLPLPTSPAESDTHLSPVSNPTANLLSDETQAYGLSMKQAVNVLEMQHGLEDDLYIIPQRSVSERFNFFLLPSSPLISRKCFYHHCPTKHGRQDKSSFCQIFGYMPEEKLLVPGILFVTDCLLIFAITLNNKIK